MPCPTKCPFDKFNHRIMNLSSDIKREFKKLYIAYKIYTNFVDVVIQKQRLRISVNMKFSEVYDPKNLCHDVTNLGRLGNGDAELLKNTKIAIVKFLKSVSEKYS
ncbi:MAG: DUF5655 domain-containing protein [Ruminococcus sp.]|uniref:DUF5655 domain-containing protein n=1 Tax=uncultured Ruminococcus sp. TaxID=165186 RepID=UPI00266F6A8F|nr:DUF5655 domain-containing protein [uncultured Ruminococcus sp.]